MEALHAMMQGSTAWLAGSIVPLLALVAGFLAARWLHAGAARRRARADRSAWRIRLHKAQEKALQLADESRRLAATLREREQEVAMLTARRVEAAGRDREELLRLQEELEADQRIGQEKARLIRAADAAQARALAAMRQTEVERERQRVSLSALQAALAHAKRAQASTEERLAGLREQLRRQLREQLAATRMAATRTAQACAAPVATERVVERIVEIPVETIVYRDREVPVEVPIEVPVGFTTVPGSQGVRGRSGLTPKYSENRPSST